MAREAFIEINFHRATLEMIHLVNSIIAEIEAQGYSITLRQLYYQLVARDLFPADRRWEWTGTKWIRNPRGTKNAEPNYKWLIEVMTNARMCGLVDWDSIEDRTRSLRGINHRKTPEEMIEDAARSFRLDKWNKQPYRVEVWVEKDALINVLEHACNPLDVDYFSCRGNTSASAIYGAFQRFKGYLEDGQQPVIIHCADHDPTGIDMTRDIIDRLQTMVTQTTGEEIVVNRIALNMDQVREFNPPPSPAKERDSRYQAYVDRFGRDCWELDAMDLPVLDKLITDAVLKYRDDEQWNKDVEEETIHRDLLDKTAKDWDGVAAFIGEPEKHITLEETPYEWSGGGLKKIPTLKKELRDFVSPDRPDNLITICNDGLAVQITAAQFRKLAGARERKPKSPSSIKTKKNKPKS